VAFVAIEAFTRFHPVVDSQSSKTVSVTTTFSAAERDKNDPGVQPEAIAAVRRLLVETALADTSPYRSARVLTEHDVFPPAGDAK
jgi:hypothetical protein